MKYQPEIHHRRSIRLKEYDYSQENAYFVTICAQHKQCLFGEIHDEKMFLNHAGLMTIKWYRELQNKFINLQCGQFVCMPNHLHFIIKITDKASVATNPHCPPNGNNKNSTTTVNYLPVGADLRVRPDSPCSLEINHVQTHRSGSEGQTHRSAPTNTANIPTIVQWYKTMTTNEYIRGVKQDGWQPFNGKLWQRNYWERVIRNENEFNNISDYIQTNPLRWEQDKLYINQSVQSVGADLCVRPIQPTNNINPSVGANLRVRPGVACSYEIKQGQTHRTVDQGQTHRSGSEGQTHRSAPTAATEIEVAQP